MEIKNKLALVTGSSRGLGKATALALAEAGADVIVNYVESKKEAEVVASMVRNHGRRSEAIQADVSKSQDVNKMATYIFDEYGPVDILVNNAGAIIRPGMWDVLKGEDFDLTFDLNLKGTIYCIQEFAPKMIDQRSGSIVNVTSTYAMTGAAAVLAYTSAKAGLISVTKSMARELGPHGITVNCVAPGNFDTDMATEAGDAINEWAISTTPLGRLGKPEEIGEAVVFLISSNFITGQTLIVDGGQILNM